MKAKRTVWGACIALMLVLALSGFVGAMAGLGVVRDWIGSLQGPPVTIVATAGIGVILACLTAFVLAVAWVKTYLFALRQYRTTLPEQTTTKRVRS